MSEGKLFNKVVQVANVPETEMSAILSCCEGGEVLFFGMNTSFQRATLGVEGIGKDVKLLMGSGYVPGHDELMFDLLRNHKPLKEWFEEKFG